MGYIKEPKGVDFIIAPSVLSDQDKELFREAIATYKKIGKTPDSIPLSSIVSENKTNSYSDAPTGKTQKKKKTGK
ncbi:hypothetical protein [Pedobacter sp. L105]|uniref:hypothetical protein n=1 Tax=Pedobacter sp. L105 TaxID=1641871 RepID=UPI00131C3AE9|nr:hypothetical protein [Pedobacter sp. L105]